MFMSEAGGQKTALQSTPTQSSEIKPSITLPPSNNLPSTYYDSPTECNLG